MKILTTCVQKTQKQEYLREGLRFWPQLDLELYSTMVLGIEMQGLPSSYQLMRYGPYPISEQEERSIKGEDKFVELLHSF